MILMLYIVRAAKSDARWDTYDSHVVAAENPEEARKLILADHETHRFDDGGVYYTGSYIGAEGPDVWRKSEVTFIGVASLGTKPRVLHSSFNAG